jgi:hypothetical protein
MCVRCQWIILLLALFFTACSSPVQDDVSPALNLLGETEFTTEQTTVILEGEIEDNSSISTFTYQLNSGEAKNVLAYLGKSLYRFAVSDLKVGQNSIELFASDASGNTVQQEIMVHVISGIPGRWQHHNLSYLACGKEHQASLNIDLENVSGLSGEVVLELPDNRLSGSFEGYQENHKLYGALSLSDRLGSTMVGQLRLGLMDKTLSGSLVFKDAIPCSSVERDDLELIVKLRR